MYCRYCGELIKDDSRFCSYCGKKLFNSDVTDFQMTGEDREEPVNDLIKYIAHKAVFEQCNIENSVGSSVNRTTQSSFNYLYEEYEGLIQSNRHLELYGKVISNEYDYIGAEIHDGNIVIGNYNQNGKISYGLLQVRNCIAREIVPVQYERIIYIEDTDLYFNVDFNEFRDSCSNLDTYLDECWVLVENLNEGIIADVDGRCFGYTINQQSFFGITIKRTITLTEIFV